MERSSPVVALGLCAALFMMDGATAATPEFQFTPRVGKGWLGVEESFRTTDSVAKDDTLGIGAGFGYLSSRGVVFEAGVDSFGSFDFGDTFDSFSLFQGFASVGYQAELGAGWRLVPRVGRARWKLRAEEGRFLNPGPEELKEVRGWDYYWELSLSRRISRVVAFGVHHKQGDYDFGKTRSTTFMVTLGF